MAGQTPARSRTDWNRWDRMLRFQGSPDRRVTTRGDRAAVDITSLARTYSLHHFPCPEAPTSDKI
jgi:hypothetical protein